MKKTKTGIVASAISLNVLFGSIAHAAPFVKVTHPDGTIKNVDCGTLVRKGNPPKTFMTCEFGKQVDINSQSLCSDSTTPPSVAMHLYISHLNTAHGGDCGFIHGIFEKQLGNDPDKVAGKNWKTRKPCSLTDAIGKCKQEFDHE